MKEIELANKLINDALTMYNIDKESCPIPCTMIDKQEYADYNIKLLTQELNKHKFNLVDLVFAPAPYNNYHKMVQGQKWFIFKQF
ncbi:MAG: hypothetical protein IJZ29_05310 [Clostridia bacterium]|nr:hypothetical protein [Clostridia bacterium]